MKKLLSLVLSLALLGASLPAPVFASQAAPAQNGQISGAVRDTSGNPVANRCIRLRDLGANAIVGNARTDASGNYIFTGLKLATYAVEVLDQSCGGAPIAIGQKTTLTAATPSVSGVTVFLPANLAAAGAAGGAGAFFTSTTGVLVLAAAGVGIGVGIYEATKSEKKDQ
ncbi:MAG: carboxypeptidase-like regulatory domain-containing protein [Vicinamibacterales bacterium]